MSSLTQINNEKVLEYFKLLSSVPHGSGNTKAISDICENFAKDHNLEYYRDDTGNIIIYKEASAGSCSDNTVILQGHLDMVCVKTKNCIKDLSRDPVTILSDGEYIWAEETSLGADDAVAIAISLTVLDDDTIEHPPICAVFTVDEETTMIGARQLDKSRITGSKMINIDSEDETELTCGCAGAATIKCCFDIKREKVKTNDVFYKISIENLTGGHSGIDIAENRANAVRLIARLIYGTSLKWDVRLCSLIGGKFDNAIPSCAEAVIAVPESAGKEFENLALKHRKLFRYEYKDSEPDITVNLDILQNHHFTCLDNIKTKTLMRCVASVPDGLRKFSEEFNKPVISSNIGIAELNENQFFFNSLIRSNESGRIEELIDIFSDMVQHDGGTVSVESEYPEWEFNTDSFMKELCKSTYKELFDKDIKETITHGGLECALFCKEIPDIDIISIGPTIKDIHSAKEKVAIESINRVFKLICTMLEKLSD